MLWGCFLAGCVEMKPKLQWRAQEIRNTKNMGHWLRKTTIYEHEPIPFERGHVRCTQQAHSGGAMQALCGTSHHHVPLKLSMEL